MALESIGEFYTKLMEFVVAKDRSHMGKEFSHVTKVSKPPPLLLLRQLS